MRRIPKSGLVRFQGGRSVDSRQRAEELGSELRRLGVSTFVSHSALGFDERQQAERAFAEAQDCVIVATSTLELGIDVGDLDRVIQIDAPGSVASFLQRLGRTGRRPGTTRNCLFLSTDHGALLRTLALLDLFDRGFVEPVAAPGKPYHLLSQQLLAQMLQHKGVSRSSWDAGLETFLAEAQLDRSAGDEVLSLLEARELVAADAGVYWFTATGERRLGGLNFLDLMSIFTSEDLFEVRWGNKEVGKVDRVTFAIRGPVQSLLLAGRSWRILQVHWERGIVSVEPSSDPGRSRWLGDGPAVSYALAQAVRRVVCGAGDERRLSLRARAAIQDARADLWWIDQQRTVLLAGPGGRFQWWTCGGTFCNLQLASALKGQAGGEVKSDEFSISFPPGIDAGSALGMVRTLRADDIPFDAAAFRPLAQKLKFFDTLPELRVDELSAARYCDPVAVRSVLSEDVRGTS
jgi:ATP-dependent Lhr-like helicase